jgi:hypothetical protein
MNLPNKRIDKLSFRPTMRSFTPDNDPPGPSGPPKIKLEPKEEPKREPKEELKPEDLDEIVEARLARAVEAMREKITSDIVGRLTGGSTSSQDNTRPQERNTASASSRPLNQPTADKSAPAKPKDYSEEAQKPSGNEDHLTKEKDLRTLHRRIYNTRLRVNGTLEPSVRAKYSENRETVKKQQDCAHLFEYLRWGGNGYAAWAHCTVCGLRSVCSYSYTEQTIYMMDQNPSKVKKAESFQSFNESRDLDNTRKAPEAPAVPLTTFKKVIIPNGGSVTESELDSTVISNVHHVHMPHGHIMLDTGCKTTVGGEEWHEDMTQAVEARGKGCLIQERDHE